MSHQHATIEDTVYIGFASNDTSGSGVDGSTPLFDVRLGGAAAGAIPVLSGTPTLLTHANYGPGAYEVAVAATAANGFSADATYLVFVTVTADGQTPAACIGSFTLTPLATAASVSALNDVAATDIVSAGAITTSSGAVSTVTTLTGHTAQTGDAFARIGATGSGLTTLATAASVAALNDVAATDIVSGGAITTSAGAVSNVTLVATTTTNTDMVGTDNAALATVATEARLAELDAANLPSDLDAVLLDTGTTLPATLGTPAADVSADIAAVKTVVDGMLTTAMTEAYAADGSPPTVAQALHLIIAYLMERSVAGTTVTAKKLDGSTTAATFTLDDGTNPTSVTRAT